MSDIKIKRKLTFKLIYSIVLFSTLVAVVATVIQLYQQYALGANKVRNQIVQIEQLSLPGLTNNLWKLYEKQVQLQLDEIIRLPGICYIEVRSQGKIFAATGDPKSKNKITRLVPIVHKRNGEDTHIGELLIHGTLEDVHAHVIDMAITVLVANGVKTGFVSLFIFFLFQFTVTRHLEAISSCILKISENGDREEIILKRPFVEDELQLVASSINDLIERHHAYEIERKTTEEERITTIEKQKDILVREVHHRIKNNLHGLIGLLEQRKKSSYEYTDIIDEAVSQIESIAIVYGLQVQNPGSQIHFKQMLDAIIRSVTGLSQVPLSVTHETGEDEISLEKAVALALVINELVMNAVKHFRSIGEVAETKVHHKYEAECIVLTICNPGSLPEGFDFQAGKGLGVGLELAKCMLPSKGTQLSILEKNNEVLAKLVLRPPLLVNVKKNQTAQKGRIHGIGKSKVIAG